MEDALYHHWFLLLAKRISGKARDDVPSSVNLERLSGSRHRTVLKMAVDICNKMSSCVILNGLKEVIESSLQDSTHITSTEQLFISYESIAPWVKLVEYCRHASLLWQLHLSYVETRAKRVVSEEISELATTLSTSLDRIDASFRAFCDLVTVSLSDQTALLENVGRLVYSVRSTVERALDIKSA